MARTVPSRVLAKVLGQSDRELPFLEHLEELRRVLLSSLVAVTLATLVAYYFSARVLEHVVVKHVGEAQFLRPMEAFVVRVKVALLLGLTVSLPFVAFEIWSFVVPGLLKHERKIVLPLVAASSLLFLGGMAFSYWLLTPMIMKLLVGFGTEHVRANIAVDYLLDFIIRMALASGLLFQLPLVVAVLTLLRVVDARWLWSKWRHAVVAILILAAVVTPGDGPSQLILAAPIVLLYFLSILIAVVIQRGRRPSSRRGDAPSEETPADPT